MHFKASHRLSINLVSGLFNFSQFSLFFQGFDDSHRFLFCSIIVNISTEPNVSKLFVERLQLKVFLVNFRKVQSFQQSCFCGSKFAAILFACFETVAALKANTTSGISWCTFEEVVHCFNMLFVYLCTLYFLCTFLVHFRRGFNTVNCWHYRYVICVYIHLCTFNVKL